MAPAECGEIMAVIKTTSSTPILVSCCAAWSDWQAETG